MRCSALIGKMQHTRREIIRFCDKCLSIVTVCAFAIVCNGLQMDRHKKLIRPGAKLISC